MELARVIDGLDRNIEGRENTVENAWQEIKRAARKLEEWIEEIADKEGDIKYKYINKQIRSEREIAENKSLEATEGVQRRRIHQDTEKEIQQL
jgi:hypothetical protein